MYFLPSCYLFSEISNCLNSVIITIAPWIQVDSNEEQLEVKWSVENWNSKFFYFLKEFASVSEHKINKMDIFLVYEI